MVPVKKAVTFPVLSFSLCICTGKSALKLSYVFGMLTLWGLELRDTSVPVAMKLLEARRRFGRLWSRPSPDES